jgi:hypothetical protein
VLTLALCLLSLSHKNISGDPIQLDLSFR